MTRTSNSLLMWAGNPIPLSTPSYHPLNPSHSFLILSYDFSSQIPDKTKQGKSESEYWNGLPFPSPRDLPNSGIKPRSPALQTGALLSEPPGKPWNRGKELLRPSSHCQHPRTLPSHLLSQMNSSWFCCANSSHFPHGCSHHKLPHLPSATNDSQEIAILKRNSFGLTSPPAAALFLHDPSQQNYF